MRQRILARGKALAARGGLLVVIVLALAMLLAGCAGSEDEADLDVPLSPEEASSLLVRVSGTEGIAYSGNYGNITGATELADDAVGAEPTDYEVEVEEGAGDGVIASFQKNEPGQGELRVQVLADDKVVVEGRTLAEFGMVNADWLPQMAPPEEMFLEEDEMILPEEEAPPEDEVEVTSEG